ncbi:MAG: hypothetical protein Homavirus12_9 [Homavirus sp.]|uniref:Uncharacterized protein n=1 Tax=Homavirus sp. TaxID=2487769 RepID=A0A3G5A4K8_9VIRU|nr:MAG: hypothetical protein Homavirus12_9 [Homavirus sp.]
MASSQAPTPIQTQAPTQIQDLTQSQKKCPVVVCLPLDNIRSKTTTEIAEGHGTPPNKPSPFGCTSQIWRQCRVGSSQSYKVDPNIRMGFSRDYTGVNVTSSSWDTIIDALVSMYPIKLRQKRPKGEEHDDYINYRFNLLNHEGKSWIWPKLAKSIKKKQENSYNSWKPTKEKEDGKITYTPELTTLFYQQGDFFAKHTDSRRGEGDTNFATVLLFEPTAESKLEGGDLVLDIGSESFVHDPHSILVGDDKDGNRIRLRVDQLKTPVLIAFQTNVPHEVEPVRAGYRICHKGNLIIPDGFSYFTNTTPNKIQIDDTSIARIKNQQLEDRILLLEREIAGLREQMGKNIISTGLLESPIISEYATRILQEINESELPCHMVVLPTNLESESDDIDPLSKMSTNELVLLNEIMKAYPYSTIQKITATRRVFDENQLINVYDEDTVEKLAKHPAPGWLSMPAFDGKVYYLGDPDVEIFGYRTHYNAEYNDSTYDYIDDVVLLTVICVQKGPPLF